MLSMFKRDSCISKNAKKIKKWHADHKQIKDLANAAVSFYEYHDIPKLKTTLKKLHKVALDHLMDEDITFVELLEKAKSENEDIISCIIDFKETIREIKTILFKFLVKYTEEDIEYNETFKVELDAVITTLIERISYEEENLYIMLNN